MSRAEGPAPVTVVVPTYRRPDHLRRCLAGLSAQRRPPALTIVVRRVEDELTAALLAGPLPLTPTVVLVDRPGVLVAMTAGLAATKTPFVAFTDDDAVPRPDWIERLLELFSDPSVGGVGGRDIFGGKEAEHPPSAARVGLVSSWGRLTGNHHIGLGPQREVDVLKGVNCMYRRGAIAIPQNLRGAGAQVHFEVAVGLRARGLGWHLIYDPAIVVDHYLGPRFDADDRSGPENSAVFDAAYNLTFAVGSFGSRRALRRIIFSLLIGDRSAPGFGRAFAGLRSHSDRDLRLFSRLMPALLGNLKAAADLAVHRRVRFSSGADALSAPS